MNGASPGNPAHERAGGDGHGGGQDGTGQAVAVDQGHAPEVAEGRTAAAGRALSYSLVDSGLSSLASFVAGLYATRYLTPAELGVYGLFYSAFVLAGLLHAEGVFTPAEVALLRHPHGVQLRALPRTLRTGFLAGCVSAVIVIGPTAMLAPRGQPRVTLALGLGAAAVSVLSPLQDHVRRMFHQTLRSHLATTVSAAQLVAVAVGLVAYDRVGLPRYAIPFAALATANVASTALGVALTLGGRARSLPADLVQAIRPRDLARVGTWLLYGNGAERLALLTAMAAITHFAGSAAAGYVEGARVLGQPVFVVGVGAITALRPRVMQAAQQRDLVQAWHWRWVTVGLLGGGAVAYSVVVGLDWWANPLPDLYPVAYARPGLLPAMVVAVALSMMFYPWAMELVAAGRARAFGHASAASSALIAVGAFVMAAAGVGSLSFPLAWAGSVPVRVALYHRGQRGYYPAHRDTGPGQVEEAAPRAAARVAGRSLARPLARVPALRPALAAIGRRFAVHPASSPTVTGPTMTVGAAAAAASRAATTTGSSIVITPHGATAAAADITTAAVDAIVTTDATVAGAPGAAEERAREGATIAPAGAPTVPPAAAVPADGTPVDPPSAPAGPPVAVGVGSQPPAAEIQAGWGERLAGLVPAVLIGVGASVLIAAGAALPGLVRQRAEADLGAEQAARARALLAEPDGRAEVARLADALAVSARRRGAGEPLRLGSRDEIVVGNDGSLRVGAAGGVAVSADGAVRPTSGGAFVDTDGVVRRGDGGAVRSPGGATVSRGPSTTLVVRSDGVIAARDGDASWLVTPSGGYVDLTEPTAASAAKAFAVTVDSSGRVTVAASGGNVMLDDDGHLSCHDATGGVLATPSGTVVGDGATLVVVGPAGELAAIAGPWGPRQLVAADGSVSLVTADGAALEGPAADRTGAVGAAASPGGTGPLAGRSLTGRSTAADSSNAADLAASVSVSDGTPARLRVSGHARAMVAATADAVIRLTDPGMPPGPIEVHRALHRPSIALGLGDVVAGTLATAALVVAVDRGRHWRRRRRLPAAAGPLLGELEPWAPTGDERSRAGAGPGSAAVSDADTAAAVRPGVGDRGIVAAIADRAERAGWRRLAVVHVAPATSRLPPASPADQPELRSEATPSTGGAATGGAAVEGATAQRPAAHTGAGGDPATPSGPRPRTAGPAVAEGPDPADEADVGGDGDDVAGPSSGVAGRLAVALADLGSRVVLVDAGGDPRTHDVLGTSAPSAYAPGFTDWASGRCSLLDAVHRAAGCHAAVMPAGAGGPADGLAVDRLPGLFRPVLEHFDLVLVDLGADGPPWAEPLMAATDAVVLVVAEPVPGPLLRAALERVGRLGLGVVGTVLVRAAEGAAVSLPRPPAAGRSS